jgi:hypothetical protein
MSEVFTETETYTRDDIARVFENFRSDLRLAARSTRLMDLEYAGQVADDVSDYASSGYLKVVHIVLLDASRATVKAEEYTVSTEASGLTGRRPGGVVWSPQPGGSLNVVVEYTKAWHDLSEDKKVKFKKQLRKPWGPSDLDVTYPGMQRQSSGDYVSRAYGLNRSSLARW